MRTKHRTCFNASLIVGLGLVGLVGAGSSIAADKKPNVVVLMQDDTGFSDFGAYLGGRALGRRRLEGRDARPDWRPVTSA